MTLIRGGLFLLALAGTIAPFKLVQYLLAKWYPIQVTGVPAPLSVSISLYCVATVVAAIVIAVCFRLIRKDREPTDKQDGLENNEEVFY